MSTRLLHDNALKEVRRAVSRAKRPALAAVAYFGKQGAKLLPLKRGSRLVVDASELAVKSGQTYPNSLLALHQKGVRIYSATHLHAKVVVVGARAFVGSANVSSRSENVLLEAVLETTDRAAVREARAFVRSLCLEELGPERLGELQAMYRPPQVPGGGARPPKRAATAKRRRELSRTWLVNLVYDDWTEEDLKAEAAGRTRARKRRQHSRSWEIDEFQWHDRVPFRIGDRVVQMVKEADGRTYLEPPGIVLNSKRYKDGRERKSFIHLEHPRVRRKSLAVLAKQIGHGAKKRLKRNGRIASGPILEGLLRAFQR